jgi:hypothetical protein
MILVENLAFTLLLLDFAICACVAMSYLNLKIQDAKIQRAAIAVFGS